MALIKGHSREVISQNIKEMVRAGQKPKQAIAAALASARKFRKMTESGMDSNEGTADMAGEPTYPKDFQEQGLSPNVVEAQELAESLEADGGMREPAFDDGGTEEPMDTMPDRAADDRRMPSTSDSGLSEEAKRALAAKKSRRRFV